VPPSRTPPVLGEEDVPVDSLQAAGAARRTGIAVIAGRISAGPQGSDLNLQSPRDIEHEGVDARLAHAEETSGRNDNMHPLLVASDQL